MKHEIYTIIIKNLLRNVTHILSSMVIKQKQNIFKLYLNKNKTKNTNMSSIQTLAMIIITCEATKYIKELRSAIEYP